MLQLHGIISLMFLAKQLNGCFGQLTSYASCSGRFLRSSVGANGERTSNADYVNKGCFDIMPWSYCYESKIRNQDAATVSEFCKRDPSRIACCFSCHEWAKALPADSRVGAGLALWYDESESASDGYCHDDSRFVGKNLCKHWQAFCRPTNCVRMVFMYSYCKSHCSRINTSFKWCADLPRIRPGDPIPPDAAKQSTAASTGTGSTPLNTESSPAYTTEQSTAVNTASSATFTAPPENTASTATAKLETSSAPAENTASTQTPAFETSTAALENTASTATPKTEAKTTPMENTASTPTAKLETSTAPTENTESTVTPKFETSTAPTENTASTPTAELDTASTATEIQTTTASE